MGIYFSVSTYRENNSEKNFQGSSSVWPAMRRENKSKRKSTNSVTFQRLFFEKVFFTKPCVTGLQ